MTDTAAVTGRPDHRSTKERGSTRRRVGVLWAAALGAAAYAGVYHLGRSWGTTVAERRAAVPGDELLVGPRLQTTHAITVAAPPEAVWPWLVQMGWGRAGWYTYRWVDRLLFPANGPSASKLLVEHQHLAVGDHIADGPPSTGCFFTVVRLEAPWVLVLHSDSHLFGSLAERDDVAMRWIWAWQLTEVSAGTRVVLRNNLQLTPVWLDQAYRAAMVPADFVMARSHLRGLRRRAEAAARNAAAAGTASDRTVPLPAPQAT